MRPQHFCLDFLPNIATDVEVGYKPAGMTTNFPFGGALTAMDPSATFIQSYPCYYNNIGGYNALEIFQDYPYMNTKGK